MKTHIEPRPLVEGIDQIQRSNDAVARIPERSASNSMPRPSKGLDEQDGAVGGTRERPEAVKDAGHLRGGVLVGTVQANERIEDEQARLALRDGGPEAGEACFEKSSLSRNRAFWNY